VGADVKHALLSNLSLEHLGGSMKLVKPIEATRLQKRPNGGLVDAHPSSDLGVTHTLIFPGLGSADLILLLKVYRDRLLCSKVCDAKRKAVCLIVVERRDLGVAETVLPVLLDDIEERLRPLIGIFARTPWVPT
jgi:hypothetical protein